MSINARPNFRHKFKSSYNFPERLIGKLARLYYTNLFIAKKNLRQSPKSRKSINFTHTNCRDLRTSLRVTRSFFTTIVREQGVDPKPFHTPSVDTFIYVIVHAYLWVNGCWNSAISIKFPFLLQSLKFIVMCWQFKVCDSTIWNPILPHFWYYFKPV